MDFLKAGLLVGAIGDAGLQLLNATILPNLGGLAEYFRVQGPVLSLLKATLLTGFWSWVYGVLDPNPSLPRFALFAGGVDLLYRVGYPVLYPTLEGYYSSNGVLKTVLCNAGVAFLIWFAKAQWIPFR